MRIGINAQLLSFEQGYRRAGVSRYIEALLHELPGVAAPDDAIIAFTSAAQRPAGFDERIDWIPSRLPTGSPPLRIAWEQTAGAVAGYRHRLDLLHSPVNVVPLAGGGPQIVTVHDLAFHHFPEQYPMPKQRYLRAMTRLSVRRASRVIAVSESTRRDLIELYDCAPERVVAIPNGVDPSYSPRGEAADGSFRAAQGLPDEFLLFVGTLQPRKNLDRLLRAYARIAGELGWPLVVVGAPGWQFDPIFRTVRQLGLGERVRFAGYVPAEELADWYSAATIFILPSIYEGYGLPALEAMACGTPVIASNTSSLPEVIGDAGLLVDPLDVAAMAGEILQLAGDDGLRQDLSDQGLRRAARLSWRRSIEMTYSVYRDLVCGA